jgi:hypothetical protein
MRLSVHYVVRAHDVASFFVEVGFFVAPVCDWRNRRSETGATFVLGSSRGM